MRRANLRQSIGHHITEQEYEIPLDAEAITTDNYEDLLEGAFAEIFNSIESDLDVLNPDRIGIVIQAYSETGEQRNFYLHYRPWGDVHMSDMLNGILNSLNSSQTLIGPVTIKVTKIPHANTTSVNGKGTLSLRGDFSVMSKRMTSIVQINSEKDTVNNNTRCMAQWICIGLARLVEGGYIQPIVELGINVVTYRLVVKSQGRFAKRQELALKLQRVFNTETFGFEKLKLVEQRYRVQFVLFSFPTLCLEYPQSIPVLDPKPVIVGVLTGKEGDVSKWEHVDYVAKPTALHVEKNHQSFRFCYLCFKVYKRSQGCGLEACSLDRSPSCGFCHTCIDHCKSCNTSDCGRYDESGGDDLEEHFLPFTVRTKCPECKTTVFSPRCLELHFNICREIHSKRCSLCLKKKHTGMECHHMRCFMCSDTFPYDKREEHQCFLKQEKLKHPNTFLAVYDFECCLDKDKIHIPYLCTVWFPFGHSKQDELDLKYPYERLEDGSSVYIFWGLGDKERCTGVYVFFTFLMDPLMEKYSFFAHNAKSYDAILVKSYMAQYKKQFSVDVQRGNKILSMDFDDLDIHFRDSLSFIPSALRSMSDDFGIEELKKGHFPHSIMTQDYLLEAERYNFVVPKPPRSAYDYDPRFGGKALKELAELQTWLDEYYSDGVDTWNMKNESVVYCISDTVLLGKTLVQFRTQMMEMTTGIKRAEGATWQPFDPLVYVTLPSAMMAFYMSQCLPLKTISVIDRGICLSRRDAECYFLYIENKNGNRLTRLNDYSAFEQESGWLYMFCDCYDNGCQRCFKYDQRNIRFNLTFQQCFASFVRVKEEIRFQYVKVVEMWSHEWERVSKEWYREQEALDPMFQFKLEAALPIDPREAYKGGKVEMYKLCHPGAIQMCDFVSEYPTTLLGESYDFLDLEGNSKVSWPMPVGIPNRLVRPVNYSFHPSKMGIVKCLVQAPTHLYTPFLGYKVYSILCPGSYEVLYGLCRSCMELRSRTCAHSTVEECAFSGTWTIAEILRALEIGYVVHNVQEVWEYEKQDDRLFREFIVPFMVEKIKSKKSGLVTNENTFTEKGLQIRDYIKELSGTEPLPQDFADCPARRTVAKLAQNSFTGKWGEKEVHRSSKTYTKEQTTESRRMLTDSSITLVAIEILDAHNDLILVNYEVKPKCSRTARRKNDIIVSHITAFGRIMLNRLEIALGRLMIYEDTDSAFHTFLQQIIYKHGFRTGDLELEVEKALDWMCCGRKWYSYLTLLLKVVAKLKGFTLKVSTGDLFSPEKLFNLFVECKEAHDVMEEGTTARQFNSTAPGIEIDQTLFATEKQDALIPFKRTILMKKKAQFQMFSMKRYIVYPEEPLRKNHLTLIDTLPFGYKVQ